MAQLPSLLHLQKSVQESPVLLHVHIADLHSVLQPHLLRLNISSGAIIYLSGIYVGLKIDPFFSIRGLVDLELEA